MNRSSGKKIQENRLVALDAFRGLTVALMILVNTPGSWSHVYPFLLHAKWDGVLPADLVFPFFLFIIGVSMFFSFSKKEDDVSVFWKVGRRVMLIFLIGLVLNYFPFYHKPFSDLRVMGVLQRIALSYGLAAFLCVKLSWKTLWKVALIMLVGYWILLLIGGSEAPFSIEGNVTTSVDLFLFGQNHMYKGFGIPFDPEGLLGAIPASVSIIFGYLIGLKIKQAIDRVTLMKHLLLIGVVSISSGLLWSLIFPLNKPIWSSSYVLFTGGVASVCLALLIGLIDIKGYQKWAKPSLVFGINPLILYVISILLVKIMIHVVWWADSATAKVTTLYGWIYRNVFVEISPSNLEFASLLFALSMVLLCWGFGAVLYKRKIIIKI
ncbi:MAG: acyltransferase family protein [Cyclobacteriaceae bacterium]